MTADVTPQFSQTQERCGLRAAAADASAEAGRCAAVLRWSSDLRRPGAQPQCDGRDAARDGRSTQQ
jgi:hypothetical protein